MLTAARIRRHIYTRIGHEVFSIRDFLNYGSRNAVDQTFHKLVKTGELIRVARGLFIKNGSPTPSALQIAMVKAAAFGRTIVLHGSKAAAALNISNACDQYIFATNGSTSSFLFGKIVIHFVRTCMRKLQLKNDPVGLAIRGLWYLGKETCDAYLVMTATHSFNRHDRQKLHQSAFFMPGWLRKCFPSLTN